MKADVRQDRRAVVAALGLMALLPARARAALPKIVRLETMGGRAAAGFDNCAALRRAFASAGPGDTVLIGAGNYEIASESLARHGAIKRPTGVALVGAGAERTTLRVAGQAVFNHLFDASGSSEVLTRAMRIAGNGVASAVAPYACGVLRAGLAPDARADMNDIMIADCNIDNFASATWVHIDNQSPRHVVRRVGSSNCRWQSGATLSPGLTSIATPGHFLYLYGVAGAIEDVRIDDAFMDAATMKGGVALIGDIAGGRVRVGTLANAGRAAAEIDTGPDGAAAYAVMVYAKGARYPRKLTIDIANLESAQSVGIYVAGGRDLTVRVGTANGQRDTRDATLLKGVIALVGAVNVTAKIGRAVDCARVVGIGVDAATAPAGIASLEVEVDEIISRKAAIDITISASGNGIVGGIKVSGQRSGPAACGVLFRSDQKTVLRDVELASFGSNGALQPIAIDPELRRRSQALMLGT